jgi:hypothetical protein
MFAIGDSLREARTRRGLSPADVQKSIRIRERYLTALEEEHWDMLPGDAYAKGFLRTYAEFLGLNGNLYVDEYNAQITHRDEEPPLVPKSLAPSHRPRTGVLRALVGILVVGALVTGLVAWRLGGSTRPAARIPAAGSLVAAGAQAAAATPAAAKAAAAKPAKAKAVVATPIAISATRGRCWLSVRTGGPNGSEIFQGVLEQGHALHYRVRQNLWVRMGRPDVIDITVGGRRVNGLPAAPGNVLLTRDGPQAA